MKHWVLHFEDTKGSETHREYPQPFYKKWQDVVAMIDEERKKGNQFFNTHTFNGKCALVDLQEQKQKFASEIGKLIYNHK